MVERGGRVRLRVIASRRGEPLSGDVRANVDPSAIMFTDDWRRLQAAAPRVLDHKVINHSAGVYVWGDIHTNTIEGFFGNLKTGMRGAYKKLSPRSGFSPTWTSTPGATTTAYGPRAMFHTLVDEARAMTERPRSRASEARRSNGEKAEQATRGHRRTKRATARPLRQRACRSLRSLRRPVFPARAFTTCWRSDLPERRRSRLWSGPESQVPSRSSAWGASRPSAIG